MGKTRPDGYWRCDENIYDKIREIIERLGYFPSAKELDKLGEHNLSHAISQYHGGFIKVRQRMGYKLVKKPNHYWRDWKNLLKALEKITEETGELPSAKKLSELGEHGLSYSIQKYHGGFRRVRKVIGEKQKRIENGKWKSLDYTLEIIKRFLDFKNLDELPSRSVLLSYGQNSLARAITLYHGGYPAVREQLKKYLGKPTENKQLESILEQYAGGSND